MEANELRIGNLVGHNNPNLAPKYLTVLSIAKDGINFWPNTDEPAVKIYLTTIEPIPFTPEILEKAGFKKQSKYNTPGVNDRYVYEPNSIALPLDHEGGNLYYWNDAPLRIEPSVRHVHELQNLIFALTGTELEINL